MSKDTWKKVEEGASVRDTSYAGIEKALGWAAGSCADILAGKDPTLADPSSASPGAKIAAIPSATLRRTVGDAVQSAAVRTFGDAPASKVQELNDRVLAELRERGII